MKRKRPPSVDMRTDLMKDESVAYLADLAGLANVYEAIGRLFALWAWCADRGLRDAPEGCAGYAVPEAVVRRFFGPRGVEAILGDGCDELALGERFGDGLIHLRGTADRVAAFRQLSATSAAGGRARASAPRSSGGSFVVATTINQPESQPDATRNPAVTPPESPPELQQEPASLLSPLSSGDLDLPESNSLDQDISVSEPDPRAIVRAEREEVPPPSDEPPDLALPLPIGWQPTHESDLVQEARALGVDLEHELAKFRERAKNQERPDWQASWRKWLLHAIGWARKGNNRKPAIPSVGHADATRAAARAELEVERAIRADNDRKAAADRAEVERLRVQALEQLSNPRKATA